MAIDILSIPAMSAEPERLFSGTKITVTDRRNRLGIASINALICLRNWYKVLDNLKIGDFEQRILELEREMDNIEAGVDRQLALQVDELERAMGPIVLD
jgi:hypothetical protein